MVLLTTRSPLGSVVISMVIGWPLRTARLVLLHMRLGRSMSLS